MDLHERFGLRRIINAYDKATSLGGARVLPEIAEVVGAGLGELAQIAHAAGVPLLVDAATQELRLREIMAMGPDLVGCSAHKYFGSTTAGIVAGRADLVAGVLAQGPGIGRGMKVGKEGILGVIAAMNTPMQTDTAAWSRAERAKVERIIERLSAIPGLQATISPDPNGCPFDRVRLTLDGSTGHTAQSLRMALRERDPVIHIRIYGTEPDAVYLNATELTDDEVEALCDAIGEEVGR